MMPAERESCHFAVSHTPCRRSFIWLDKRPGRDKHQANQLGVWLNPILHTPPTGFTACGRGGLPCDRHVSSSVSWESWFLALAWRHKGGLRVGAVPAEAAAGHQSAIPGPCPAVVFLPTSTIPIPCRQCRCFSRARYG